MSSFGFGNTASTQSSAGTLFGAGAPTSTSSFGSTANKAGTLFGTSSSNSSAAGTLFGGSATATPSSSTSFGGFGAASSALAPSTTFGANSSTPATGGFGGFGIAPTTSTAGTTGFGGFGTTPATSTAGTTGFGGFGTTPATSTAGTTGFGGFGAANTTNTAPATGFGGFGAAPATSTVGTTGFGGFGTTPATITAGTTGFGGFGTTPATSTAGTTGFGGFGAASATSTAGVTGFGGFGAASATNTAGKTGFGGFGATFGTSNTNTTGFGGFGSTNNAPTSVGGFGGFGSNNMSNGINTFGTQQQQQQSVPVQEKVWQELALIRAHFDPASPLCQFRHYFYNKVPSNEIQFYGRPPNQDEQLWNEAVRKNPDPTSLVPVLAIGFDDILKRMEIQSKQVELHQDKVIEIEERFKTVQRQYSLGTLIKLEEYRRRHTYLTQRLLRLLRYSQVLRYKGFPLSADEEKLMNELSQLKSDPNNPEQLNAKMINLWNQLQSIKIQKQNNEHNNTEVWRTVNEEDTRIIGKVLSDSQQGIKHVTNILKEDIKDLEAIEDELKGKRKLNNSFFA